MTSRAFAPAKLNLYLHVGTMRADGRHDVESLAVFADIGDIVSAAEGEGLSLVCTGAFASALTDEPDNLVLRAARALREGAGLGACGATLTLEKNLPVASGIGGGSSDAAATLKALNVLWGARAGASDLARIAQGLGADVPACLAARPVCMTGAGDIIAPCACPAFDAVIVNPLVALSTGAVYGAFDSMGLGAGLAPLPSPNWPNAVAAIEALRARRNDLAAPARALCPAIAEVEAALASDPRARLVRLSGSGASVFALVDDAANANALARALALAHPRWWVRAVRLDGAPA